MAFNIIIAGSRGFNDRVLLADKLAKLLVNKTDICVICGDARGADFLGREWAGNNGHEVITMPAQWDMHGKRAGYIRNTQMAKIADACVVFWDGQSRGSKHMIDICRKRDIPLRVVQY